MTGIISVLKNVLSDVLSKGVSLTGDFKADGKYSHS